MLYASDTVRCAFWETLARNRFARRRRRELPRSEVEARLVVSIGSTGPLALIDLRGDGPVRIGAPSAVAHRRQPCGGPRPVGGRPCRRAGGERISVRVEIHGRCLRSRVRPGLRQAEDARRRRACPARRFSGCPRRLRYCADGAAGVAETGNETGDSRNRAIPENGGGSATGAACGVRNTVDSGHYLLPDFET